MGFRKPWAVFRMPKLRIVDSTSKIFPDSGFLNNAQVKIYWNPKSRSPYMEGRWGGGETETKMRFFKERFHFKEDSPCPCDCK